MNKSSIVKLMSAALAALMLLSGLTLAAAVSVSAEEEKTIVITIDPGHGPDSAGTGGAVQYGGKYEHVYTFSMATYAKERMEQYKGVEVHMTRTAEETPDLSARPRTAADHKSDAFVSIHINAANKTAGGTEVWVPNNSWRPEIANNSRAAATPVLESLVSTFELKNRGLKTSNSGTGATYPDGSPADKLTVIKVGKEQNIPVVMLIEVAFADNKSDYEKVFSTEEGLQKAGYAIADGLAQYYGLSLAPTTEFIHASNDELRLMNEAGEQIGQGFTPGQYDAWESKTVTFGEGSVHSLADWGWAAFKSQGFQFGYIVNGRELFDDSFVHETEQAVLDAFAALKAPNGSRFLGVLPADMLTVGENTVQFCIKLDEDICEVIREYKVVVTEKITEAPTEPPTEPVTEAITEAPTEAPSEAPTDSDKPSGGCSGSLAMTAVCLTVLAGAALVLRRKD